MLCFHVSDLHGSTSRYSKLVSAIRAESPRAVFLGGDLLPSSLVRYVDEQSNQDNFIDSVLVSEFGKLKDIMGESYPRVFLIMGNDDIRAEEPRLREAAQTGLWEYIHLEKVKFQEFTIYGYACVPPTPFMLKDWENYDVSRNVEPGSISPEEGWRSTPVSEREARFGTIKIDIEKLTSGDALDNAICLFHSPPYGTTLDRAALDGVMIDHAPLDLHIGSVAIRQFIEERQPLLALHGHVHESARITGAWQDSIGRTHLYSAAHDGPELALIRFDPNDLGNATRELL